jgi:hypothetical protein
MRCENDTFLFGQQLDKEYGGHLEEPEGQGDIIKNEPKHLSGAETLRWAVKCYQ